MTTTQQNTSQGKAQHWKQMFKFYFQYKTGQFTLISSIIWFAVLMGSTHIQPLFSGNKIIHEFFIILPIPFFVVFMIALLYYLDQKLKALNNILFKKLEQRVKHNSHKTIKK